MRDLEKSDAFKKVKALFCEYVTLTHPDLGKSFYFQTDASDLALDVVLHQTNENNEHLPLSFTSRTLKGSEFSYYTTEKELLAIMWVLMKFRSYVLGAKLIIRTDHKALTFLKTCKLVSGRLTRWIMAI